MDRTNEQLTLSFNLAEFRCRDGTHVPTELMANARLLATNLQVVRDHLGKPLVVISGYRTPEHNRRVGGASRSQHLFATTADVRCAGVSPQELYQLFESLIATGAILPGGLSQYRTFVHYDVRGRNAGW